MAAGFYGFGRWEAEYWFVGPEQGMAKVSDSLEARCRCWEKLHRGELVDCIAYHRCLGYTRFHEPPFRLQPTWRRLILLLLTFKNELPIQSRIREYQGTRWGISAGQGETCILDLSALAAPNLKTVRDRDTFAESRIRVLRKRMEQHKPKFVVTYGLGNRGQFQQLVGGPFDRERFRQLDWAGQGTTIAMLTPAPTAFGDTDEDWINFGFRLRQRCESVTNAHKKTHAQSGS